MGRRDLGDSLLRAAWLPVGDAAEKDRTLLKKYWSIPERQVETSVVLADRTWFASRMGLSTHLHHFSMQTTTTTKEKILTAAMSLVSEKGYLGATTREIAHDAGVTELTLFRHFGSKEKLFEEVLGKNASCRRSGN